MVAFTRGCPLSCSFSRGVGGSSSGGSYDSDGGRGGRGRRLPGHSYPIPDPSTLGLGLNMETMKGFAVVSEYLCALPAKAQKEKRKEKKTRHLQKEDWETVTN
ncbi:hypothetical protein LEMLEM_LOCUS22693 [Lemmus lemmus]